MGRKQRILMVCPTSWERAAAASPELADEYEFLSCCEDLEDAMELRRALTFDTERYLQAVIAEHRGRGIDGILAVGDYPGCIFGAYIAQGLGLKAPTARSVLLLSHKFHSRQIQQRCAPDSTPRFAAVDPLWPRKPGSLEYPFFIKPVKGTMSIRARMVRSRVELHQALWLSPREWASHVLLFLPLMQLFRRHVPDAVPVRSFIAEAPLCGQQVTVDGFVQDGRATIMGIVDSIMYPGTMSFRRFEYPSSLPAQVLKRMSEIATRVMEGSGFDHSCFNMELFYDPEADTISIIEINPRMSYQFSDLFGHVDGLSSFAAQLRIATGRPVDWTPGRGAAGAAASFVMRRFSDAKVLAVPDSRQIAEIEQRYPGAQVRLLCEKGERLSDHDQDVGSYRYCMVNMAAPSHSELHARFADVERRLPFSFAA